LASAIGILQGAIGNFVFLHEWVRELSEGKEGGGRGMKDVGAFFQA